MQKSSLSQARQELVELIQSIRFGRIVGLVVRDGEPVFEPGPQVERSIKLLVADGGASRPPPADFNVKRAVAALMEILDTIGNGTIERIEVRHGLPFQMILQESPPRTPEASP